MAPIRTTPFHDPSAFLSAASRVATSYGFSSLNDLVRENNRRRVAKTHRPVSEYKRGIDAHSGEIVSAVKSCIEHDLVGEEKPPALIYFSNLKSSARPPKVIYFGLGFVGSQKSIAEALLIKTAFAILDEVGVKDPCLHINSVGDRDSLARLTRELTSYFRKHVNALPPQGQQALKRDVLAAFEYIHQKQHELCDTAPRPMEFLTDASRRHLREIIEYLDAIGSHYEIDDTLVGTRDCHSQTLMEIRAPSSGKSAGDPDAHDEDVIAWGGRLDEMSRHLFRVELPVTGIVFSCKSRRGKLTEQLACRAKRPQVFFVQLGFEAKLRSLPLLDNLRRSRINVDQYLDSDRLSEQLSRAEALGVPYTIIIGHKEALEDTAIVRNMNNRSQEIIPLDELPDYLRAHLRKT